MLTQLMIARLMFHPAGLMKKAWRKTLRRTASADSDSFETIAPPIWPYRYRSAGIALFAPETHAAPSAPVPSEPPRPGMAGLDGLPFTSAHFSYDNHAASFLGSHAS